MKNNKPTVKELFEEKFLYNDSVPATATKFLLAFLAAGPLLIAGAALPGLLSATKSISHSKKYSKTQFQNAYKNLRHRKLIEIIEEGDDKFKVQLTNTGQTRVKEFSFKLLKIKKPHKWDGKWRILVFDIPSNPAIYNQARNALRNKIKDLGFYQMQKSVWVYPYECTDEILFVAEAFSVQKHIEIITAEKLLHEEKIKKIFKL
jgi:virulence-associated protein VapD